MYVLVSTSLFYYGVRADGRAGEALFSFPFPLPVAVR